MNQLLTTKLFKPNIRLQHVSRPHLVERLNEGAHGTLTVISAPAGFGKTMLLSEWTSQVESELIWISLDISDNDISLFLSYIVQGLLKKEIISVTFCEDLFKMIRSSNPPIVEIMICIINKITEMGNRLVLVLDDFHYITSNQVINSLSYLVENAPDTLHVVLASRKDINLPLTRLRANGLLTEIHTEHLRFNSDEIATFINKRMKLNLSKDELSILEARSEGWIVALQLAGISIRGGNKSGYNSRSMLEKNRFVLDYLLNEVLSNQSEEMSSFLMQTSILNRFSVDLCNYITGRDNSDKILEALIQENMFIFPLDDDGCWFRYHHLFSDMLQKKNIDSSPEDFRNLHKKASVWFEQNSSPVESIEHSIKSEDVDRTVDLLKQYSDDIIDLGEFKTVWRWLEVVPEKVLLSQPTLGILQAWKLLAFRKLDESMHYLEAIEKKMKKIDSTDLGKDGIERIKGRFAAVSALLNSYKGNISEGIHYGQEALLHLPASDFNWRNMVYIALGDAYAMQGNIMKSFRVRTQTLDASIEFGNVNLSLLNAAKLVGILGALGKLNMVVKLCRKYVSLAEEHGLFYKESVACLFAAWAQALANKGLIDEAMVKAKSGEKIYIRLYHGKPIASYCLMSLIKIYISEGEFEKANEIILRLKNISRKTFTPPYINALLSAYRVRILIKQNELELVNDWLSEKNLSIDGTLTQLNEVLYLEYARFLMIKKRLDDAVHLLDRLFNRAEHSECVDSMIQILILQVVTYQSMNNIECAQNKLRQALVIAEQTGYIQVFVDEGEPIEQLLYKLLEEDSGNAFIQSILSKFPKSNSDDALIEQLSKREVEVFMFLSKGLSRKEVSEALFISPHTIKTHMRNVYAKIGVNNKTQAINKIRSMGLI